jgi:hypothetical protein
MTYILYATYKSLNIFTCKNKPVFFGDDTFHKPGVCDLQPSFPDDLQNDK